MEFLLILLLVLAVLGLSAVVIIALLGPSQEASQLYKDVLRMHQINLRAKIAAEQLAVEHLKQVYEISRRNSHEQQEKEADSQPTVIIDHSV